MAVSGYGLGFPCAFPAADLDKGSLSLEGDIARCVIRACE